MRLDKFLTDCGYGSRREVEGILETGRIKVNGEKEKKGKIQVKENSDLITLDDKQIVYKKYYYYVMNKPAGVITATEDKRDKTVMDIMPDWVIKKDLSPVGRLDKDTEGLLLFTNDGQLSHELLSPKKHVMKKYYVELEKNISDSDILKLEQGVTINDNYLTKEAIVDRIDEDKIFLSISEGKFHQIKFMANAVDNEVTYLKRVAFGKLELKDLEKGNVIEVKREDI